MNVDSGQLGDSPKPVRLRALLWGVAIPLTTATQTRFGGGVGVGELLMVLLVVESFCSLIINGRVVLPKHLIVFTVFCAVSSVALASGGVFAAATDRMIWVLAQHDLKAYLFSAISIWMLFARFHLQDIYRIYMTLVIFSVSILVLFLLVPSVAGMVGVIPWLDGYRYVGWAENPNQIALLASATLFLNWGLFFTVEKRRDKVVLLLVTVGVLWLGYETLSDALVASWVFSFGAMLGVDSFSTSLVDKAKIWTRRLAWVLMIGGMILVITRLDLLLGIKDVVANAYHSGGQGSDRVTLWKNGLQAFQQSPFVGFGPGPHSGLGGASSA